MHNTIISILHVCVRTITLISASAFVVPMYGGARTALNCKRLITNNDDDDVVHS